MNDDDQLKVEAVKQALKIKCLSSSTPMEVLEVADSIYKIMKERVGHDHNVLLLEQHYQL